MTDHSEPYWMSLAEYLAEKERLASDPHAGDS